MESEGVRQVTDRRRREELLRSLQNPHSETEELLEQGMQEWSCGLPDEDAEALVDTTAGKTVRWIRGAGWTEDPA